MKKITKKELNERVKLLKKHCLSVDEKIIFKDYRYDDSVLLVIKTIDSYGSVWDYTFFNNRDLFDEIKLLKYSYSCDTKTYMNIYL